MTPLLDLPHREAVRRLRDGAVVFLFANPVEFHGPHLSLHNDHLVSRGLAGALEERLRVTHPDWDFLATADLEAGMEPVAGPGTRHPPFHVVRALVLESCRALLEMGARRVILMTFHGDPMHNHALQAGVELLRRGGARAFNPFNGMMQEMLGWKADEPSLAGAVAHLPADRREDVLRTLNLDFHAGFLETSLALHYAPHSVDPVHRTLPPCAPWTRDGAFLAAAAVARRAGAAELARDLAFAAEAMGWKALRPFPGYTSAPSWATPEAGAIIGASVVSRFAAAAEDVLAGRGDGPAPVMGWLLGATLGGRVALPVPSLETLGLA
ncbi:MAG: creatininase family protein [Deltaproteobacteria bacterium]|nr:creatininase family protein [Deltaproteobacteria bacterium]